MYDISEPKQTKSTKELLEEAKARYELMKYEQKIKSFGQPRPFYNIKTTKTIISKPSKPVFTKSDYQQAAKNIGEAYRGTRKAMAIASKGAKAGYKKASSLASRANKMWQ